MLVEVLTFRLMDGADEEAFLAADKRVQAMVSSLEGFVRRTTARGADGEWLVLCSWWGSSSADAAPADQGFAALIDPSSVDRRRYDTLD